MAVQSDEKAEHAMTAVLRMSEQAQRKVDGAEATVRK